MKVQWNRTSLFRFYPETKPLKFHVTNAERLLPWRFVLNANGMRGAGYAKAVQKFMNAMRICGCRW
jgi:hypothetical protein